MRKYQQKQLLALALTLESAHKDIENLISKGSLDQAIELLGICQEAAVTIGESIETWEGEGLHAVTLLEEYCDCLYQAGEQLEDRYLAEKSCKRLRRLLIRIQTELHNLPLQYEIVFLPYKASMWDSLESVWEAASIDPSCICHVVPIPYFDRRPDGALGQIHDETDLYPASVPVTSWIDFPLEKIRPDVIYIHNPYDDGNLVTTVHPRFYSKELKRYTDLLVYIPYFVCVDDVSEDLCISNGTLYADRVIVQSEKARDTYIRMFHQFERDNHCKGRFGVAEEKFMALGSPKFDKVLAIKKEDVAVPDSWLEKIERNDGSWKKIVLYNTSIAGALEGNEKIIRKLYNVFRVFQNHRDVVLLWRPHPLNTTTYATMRPELLSDYMKCVEAFKSHGWGIYDDTPDVHRAIAISDAYYGDGGSLLAMYQVTGKPIMIQNLDVLE